MVDADLRQFFDTIDQEKLLDLIAEEISDGRVLGLIRAILDVSAGRRRSYSPPAKGPRLGTAVVVDPVPYAAMVKGIRGPEEEAPPQRVVGT